MTELSNRSEILLESGTNELEVLVFTIADEAYGVNVAKVREVIRHQEVSSAPEQHTCVRGMFNLRNHLLALVDLPKYLDVAPAIEEKDQKIIVTEFNNIRMAFLVDTVERIYRISWSDIRPVPTEDGDQHAYFTGITEIDERLILMLDFESVSQSIAKYGEMDKEQIDAEIEIDRSQYRVILTDDSNMIRTMMAKTLTNSGYTKLKTFENGKDCWEYIESTKGTGNVPHLIISDIEMPLMDGLHMTKRVKDDDALKHIPILLFSSLISPDTMHKVKKVGANEALAKPNLPELVLITDKWLTDTYKGKA